MRVEARGRGDALREFAERRGCRAVVLCGADPRLAPARAAELARQGLEVLVLDPCRAVLERVRAEGGAGVRTVQGRCARALADVVRTLPGETLYVLDGARLGPAGLAEALFYVPRAKGWIALAGAPVASVRDQLLRWSPEHEVEEVEVAGSGRVAVVAPAPRTHVTFLIEKYSHEYRASGLSINLDNLVATLDQAGLATWNVVHYDERYHEGPPLGLGDLRPPVDADQHVIVCTCHYHSLANPDSSLLAAAKAAGSRVVFVWLDKRTSISTPAYYELADVNVVLDGNDFELPRAWPIFTPKNPVHFHDPGWERDLDVTLVGEMRYLEQRRHLAERLRSERRIPVRVFETSAVDGERSLSLEEYAGVFKRSKISIALTKDATRQLKGRVFEIAHCGALLLCDPNPFLPAYLTPGEEYVVFRDYEELVERCRYYLEHEEERARLAAAGHAKVTRHCSAALFWRSLLERVRAVAREAWVGP